MYTDLDQVFGSALTNGTSEKDVIFTILYVVYRMTD
jgi:hypothetical protein